MVSKLCTLKCNIKWRGWCLFIHRKKAPLSKLAKTWLRSATPIWWRTPATYGRNMWREISATRFASLKKLQIWPSSLSDPGWHGVFQGDVRTLPDWAGGQAQSAQGLTLTLRLWNLDPETLTMIFTWSCEVNYCCRAKSRTATRRRRRSTARRRWLTLTSPPKRPDPSRRLRY